MPVPSQVLHWTLDDEALGRQYDVRICYELDRWEPGDPTTPGCGGNAVVETLEVLQARHLDEDGQVRGVDLGAAARRHDDRAWLLIGEDPELSRRLEQVGQRA